MSFNFMAAVTICSDFGAPQNKICHCFYCFPIYFTYSNVQEKKKDLQNQSQTIKKMAIGAHISIIALNVNGLNAPTKSHRLAEWIQKQDP